MGKIWRQITSVIAKTLGEIGVKLIKNILTKNIETVN
jgi:hypothetical protein